MVKHAIYGRASCFDGKKGERSSFKRQRDAGEAQALKLNVKLDQLKLFTDSNVSGATSVTDRVGFQDLLSFLLKETEKEKKKKKQQNATVSPMVFVEEIGRLARPPFLFNGLASSHLQRLSCDSEE